MPDPSTLKLDMTKEQIMTAISIFRSYGWIADMDLASLPKHVDDAERDFGMDIYDRMMRDDSLSSSVDAIKIQVMSEGPKLMAPVSAPPSFKGDAEAQGRYERAEAIRSEFERMCDDLQQPLEDILLDMLDAVIFGHRMAEKVYTVQSGKLMLSKLQVKERDSYAFAVDKFMNLHGLVSCNGLTGNATLMNPKPGDLIPREKFFVLSFRPKCGDPRGRSILRPAYNAWYQKLQLWPHYLKYLLQFATPGIAAISPPDATFVEETDASGNVLIDEATGQPRQISPEDAILRQLIAFASGTALVLPHGSSITPIEVQGDGEAYLKAFEMFDRRCVRTVLLNTRAVMEAEFGSKADSQTGQDLLGTVVQHVRRWIEVSFYRDVIRPWYRLNYGDDLTLCPMMSLSAAANEDIVAIGNMVANLARAGVIRPEQLPGIFAMLRLPEIDLQSLLAELQEEKDNAKMLQGALPEPVNQDEDEDEQEE